MVGVGVSVALRRRTTRRCHAIRTIGGTKFAFAVTQASLILELEGTVASAKHNARSTGLVRPKENCDAISAWRSRNSVRRNDIRRTSHAEIARLIARDHGWKLRGDQIIDQNEVVVTETLEELARKALSLDWFDPTGAGINWHHFGGTKVSNADTVRQTSA